MRYVVVAVFAIVLFVAWRSRTSTPSKECISEPVHACVDRPPTTRGPRSLR